MLNSYSKAYNNLNINAVSGTLIKSHPKSFFKTMHSSSGLAESVLSEKPKMSIGKYNHNYGRYEEVDVIVLQVMLTGNDRHDLMVEIVRRDDFLESEE